MSIGLSKMNLVASIKRDIQQKTNLLSKQDIDAISDAVASAIDKNNREIEKYVNWKINNI